MTTTSSSMFNLVTFLWHDPKAKHTGTFSYGFDHVVKLFKQAARGFEENGIEDYRLTLVTDSTDVTGLGPILANPRFRVIPLWNDFRNLGRCFTKLKMFSALHTDPIYGEDIPREALFPGDYIITIDLDIVIIKPKEFIEALTSDRLQPFKGYRDTKNPRCYSGALWRIDTRHYGGFHNVYDTFRHVYDLATGTDTLPQIFNNWNKASSFVGSDQSWITTAIGEHAFPRKWNDEEHGLWDYWQIQHLPTLPLNTMAVFMNGMRRDSSMPEYQQKHPWIVEHWVNV